MDDDEIVRKLRSGELEFVKFKTSYLKSLPASSILSDAGLVFEKEEGGYCIFRNLKYKSEEKR